MRWMRLPGPRRGLILGPWIVGDGSPGADPGEGEVDIGVLRHGPPPAEELVAMTDLQMSEILMKTHPLMAWTMMKPLTKP